MFQRQVRERLFGSIHTVGTTAHNQSSHMIFNIALHECNMSEEVKELRQQVDNLRKRYVNCVLWTP